MGCREDCSAEGWCGDHRYQRHPTNGYTTKLKFPVNHTKESCSSMDKLGSNGNVHSTNSHHISANYGRDDKLTDEPKRDVWYFRGQEVDLSRFLRFHPGGTSSLKTLRGGDVEPSMESARHSPESYYFLRDFYNGNREEDVVDWSKPMLGQVGSLGALYETWVWSPVDRPLRLFESDILEKLTRTNWQQVVGTWVPVIIAGLALSLFNSPEDYSIGVRIPATLTWLLCGMAVWPLVEYSIHRWLFHLQPPKTSSFLIIMHFGLHGLHHKVPFDEGRLLFPPGPCSVMALAVYSIYSRLFPWWIAVALFSGTMLGYLIYDLIHYYLHHGNPKDGSYLYRMKRYHNQHHFAQQELGFGISSDFWDHAFDTLIKLKKLKKPLCWDT